jgi:hypothetical protein
LPDIVSRSLNRLHDALARLYLQRSSGEPVSIRDAVKKSYVNQMLGDEEHVGVLLEALNEIAPRGGADPD